MSGLGESRGAVQFLRALRVNLLIFLVFFHGRRIVRRADEKPYYYIDDHLGSRRLLLGPTGGNYHESDYYSYGGERVIVNTADSPHKFTGKERDAESGLDYFGARYYGSTMGRLLSPDPRNFGTKINDAQTWNAYGYGRNNPLLYVDPDVLRTCMKKG